MKRLLLLFLLASIAANAQLREKGRIEIKPSIGSSISYIFRPNNFYSSLQSAMVPYPSTNFGVTGDYYFNNRWSLRSGLQVQTMGAYYLFSDVEEELNYLSVPVNANWHFGSTRKWNLNFGLTSSFLMNANENGVDIKDKLNNSQLGMSFGIGYKLEITKNFSFLFEEQIFYGLTSISKTDDAYSHNGSLNIGAVYCF